MRDIQASDAKAHLPRILDDVERGETVRITRHRRPHCVPEANRRQEEIDRAIESIGGASPAHRKDHARSRLPIAKR